MKSFGSSKSYLIRQEKIVSLLSTIHPLTRQITESELITLIRARRREGFDLLYENYSAVIFGVICRIVTDTTIAEDLMQDVFVRIWRNIDQYEEGKGRLYTWMINITRNVSIDFLRSKEHKNHQKIDSDATERKGIHDNTLIRCTDNIGIQTMVNKLEDKHREVIDTIFFGGYTYAEAAEVLNIPLGTLKTRVRAALQILKGEL